MQRLSSRKFSGERRVLAHGLINASVNEYAAGSFVRRDVGIDSNPREEWKYHGDESLSAPESRETEPEGTKRTFIRDDARLGIDQRLDEIERIVIGLH